MLESEYEYYGMLATTWDLLRGDTSRWDDRFFYLDVIRKYGQPVLDVGCGTGRLLLDYQSQGIDIDGVDISPEMLDLLKQKASATGLEVRLYRQKMEALDLPRRYCSILVPSSSFQLLLEPAQVSAAMQGFFHHLLPGGALTMPFMLIWKPGDPRQTEWRSPERIRPQDGAVVRKLAKAWVDPAAQLEHTEDRYEVLQDGVVIESETHRRSPATRWYTQAQAIELYRQAGFSRLEVCKKFTFEPAEPDDEIFTIIGIKGT